MRNLLMICGLIIILFSSCYNDKADKLYVSPVTTQCDTTNITYSGTINPIIAGNCATSGCHDQSTIASGYDMTTYNGLLRAVKSGTLVPAIQHTGSLPFMPQTGAKLANCDIQKIVIWINAGALQN